MQIFFDLWFRSWQRSFEYEFGLNFWSKERKRQTTSNPKKSKKKFEKVLKNYLLIQCSNDMLFFSIRKCIRQYGLFWRQCFTCKLFEKKMMKSDEHAKKAFDFGTIKVCGYPICHSAKWNSNRNLIAARSKSKHQNEALPQKTVSWMCRFRAQEMDFVEQRTLESIGANFFGLFAKWSSDSIWKPIERDVRRSVVVEVSRKWSEDNFAILTIKVECQRQTATIG